MECQRCGNRDPDWFAYDPFHNNDYCRKCIAFGRMNADEPLKSVRYSSRRVDTSYQLKYPLTPAQQKAVAAIADYRTQGTEVIIYAACGAGKTELVMDSIQRALREGKKVGFAISRRQVVLEICDRMAQAFPQITVVAVCEGHTQVVDGDLIICTMHQLYRYPHTFDLLIMDEIDAFPYRGDTLLETIARHSCKGQRLYLTATPDEAMLDEVKQGKLAMVELFQRPHGYPLVVPRIIHTLPFFQLWYCARFLLHRKKAQIPVLVFVPTIRDAHRCHRLFQWLVRSYPFTSQSEDKEKIIADFHDKRYDCLFTTTILERGITIHGVDVAVLHCDHTVFNEASLIQIIGRVGRSAAMPTGTGLFLCQRVNRDIKRCVRAIRKMNESLIQESTVKLHETMPNM